MRGLCCYISAAVIIDTLDLEVDENGLIPLDKALNMV
jgi:hypothetical protein